MTGHSYFAFKGIRKKKSQIHRIVRVGGDLWRSSSPASLPRQGHLDQVTQECVQLGFECLYGQGDFTNSLGSLVQCSATLNKKLFLMMRKKFLCFSLRPLLLILSLCTTEKGLELFSWHHPSRYLIHEISVYFSLD